jgi:hypothetical protein
MTINSEHVATYNSEKTSLNPRIMLGKLMNVYPAMCMGILFCVPKGHTKRMYKKKITYKLVLKNITYNFDSLKDIRTQCL